MYLFKKGLSPVTETSKLSAINFAFFQIYGLPHSPFAGQRCHPFEMTWKIPLLKKDVDVANLQEPSNVKHIELPPLL